ncbi:MAG: hypothetical protein OEM79_04340 [Nitrosopumilus sp.]|nr:hypothetical protein [Nitrosopumilus sp.]
MKKYLFFAIIFLLAILPLAHSLTILEQNDDLHLLQAGGDNLTEETKKIESQINEKILKNNFIDNIFENPEDSGPILFDYFNELFHNVIADSSIYDLIAFSIGMVIYGIFVYHFYKFLSKRDMFSINIGEKISGAKFKSSGQKLSVVPRAAAFLATKLFIFPFVIFMWFIGYSSFMFMLVQNMPTETIFLVSSGLIIAVRISAYYNEDLSKDIAKLVPFTLLGIFLFNPQFYSFSDTLTRLFEIPSFIIQIGSFMLLAMVVEITLSTLYLIRFKFFHKESSEKFDEHKDAV